MQTLDPHNIPLESVNLIEASAGTGKSWTVSLLVLRLILEKELTIDQILVVTFTEAATKELREAVRNRIIEALAFFKDPKQTLQQKEYTTLYEKQAHGIDELAIQRLKRAKLSIDEAAIFTIHGFCQRALSEYAFEAGLPFESELMESDAELMQKLTDDFWRRNLQTAPQALLFKLQHERITPDSLLNDIKHAVGKPYLTLCGPPRPSLASSSWQDLEKSFTRVMRIWSEDGCEIAELVFSKDLNGNKYRKATVEKNCKQMRGIKSLADINLNILQDDLKRFKSSTLSDATKAKCQTPCHQFFDAWEEFSDLYEALDSSAKNYISQLRIDLLKYLQQELPKEKRRLGVLSFDDLLLNLQQALNNQPDLASVLNKKYRVALIDEFQDTDPVQYDIFSRIYKHAQGTAMFLVGDPKQAIYRFRGGDIHTYLEAKKDTLKGNCYTIKTNWRSHPKLITALNTLYDNGNDCFKEDHINYIEVDSGLKTSVDHAVYQTSAPLQFWECIPELDDKGSPIGGLEGVKKSISDAIAGDIAQRLNDKKQGLIGSDIAILVRSHNQGTLIKDALNARNIASVQSSKDSIFETHEASELLRVLIAIVEPQQEDPVRRALVTELLGFNADDLTQFEKQTDIWEKQLAQFQHWHYAWKEQGFLPMFNTLVSHQNIHQRLLSFADGERRLTNLLQLSELIHHATKKHALSMEEVLRWLRQQQENTHHKESELRLESDDKLVKIVTIWKAKGLEYPIVYCPFVGLNRPDFKESVFSFYQNNQACLEIGSKDFDEHKAIKTLEEDAEETRLLYVALTRAKYQCTVVCFPDPIKRSPDRSALGWLLSKGETIDNKKDFIQAYASTLKKLGSTKEIGVNLLPKYDASLVYKNKQSTTILVANKFSATLKSQAQITSFSGLTAGAHAETPEHDSSPDKTIQLPPLLDTEFPRGATAGSALHEVYENLNFTKPVDTQQDIILNSLLKWGFDKNHLDATNLLMTNSLKAEIGEGFSLSMLSQESRLNEMEFHLPLVQLAIDKLQQILFKHLPKTNEWQLVRDAVDGLYFDQVKGYLKGFIDLIFIHDGKYYVADYKSNSLLDYSPEHLMPVMANSHYYLQYLLYSVALHRYLQKRVPNYHWDTHIGGVYYLFIRGMSLPTGTKNTTENATKNTINKTTQYSGVFFDKPSLVLIEALDSLFTQELSHV